MESDFQSCLLGDVVFRSNVTISVSLTVAGPTTYTWQEDQVAGNWFPNAPSLALYMLSGFNTLVGTDSSSFAVELVTDPDDANYRKLKYTASNTLGTVTNFVITVPDVYADLGLSGPTTDFGAGTDPHYTDECPYVLTPYWPVAQYDTAVQNITGYSEQAHDGSMYSTAGQTQRTITLSVALDRSSNFNETLIWMRLWRDRWTRGRSVTFYMDRSLVPPVFGSSWNSNVENADILELPSSGEGVDFSRMMDMRELINYSKPTEFVHREVRLDDYHAQAYNGQMSIVPVTDTRVTSWYRASVGDALTMTFAGMPEPDNCCAAIWFRVRKLPTNGNVINDTAWSFPYSACCIGTVGPGTFEMDMTGPEHDVHPRVGAWNLLTFNAVGGELTCGINGSVTDTLISFVDMDGVFTLGHSGGTIEVEFANIGIFRTKFFTPSEAAALYAAGVSFDYANPYGAWAGVEPRVYICDEPDTVGMYTGNSSTSSEPATLDFPGAPTWGLLATA